MARVKLEFPAHFQFSTEIAVRISDINYGGHLGHDSIISLIHEARLRFLNAHGFSESDIDGFGLIIADLVIVYKAEGFYGEILIIEVDAQDFNKYGCDLVYRITSKDTGKEVAQAKTGVLIFDYKRRKVVSVPAGFKNALSLNRTGKAEHDIVNDQDEKT